MMKIGAPPKSCTVWLPIEFYCFTSRINSKGYHSLVPCFISFFLETVWVPLTKQAEVNIEHISKLTTLQTDFIASDHLHT